MSEERLFEETLKEAAGFMTNRDRGTRFPLTRIAEVQDLIYNSVFRGETVPQHVRAYLLQEALTTADFPFLFGDVLDRQMLASYKATIPVWQKFTKLSTVNDFKLANRFAISGGDEGLDLVAEKGEYLASQRAEIRYQLQVAKYGRQFDISWESLINDDLGALKDTPERFARAAMRTEHRIASTLYVHNVVLATIARGNLSVNPLTIANLETGLQWFPSVLDVGGEPIQNRAKYLVVPPAGELTARQILTSATKMWLAGATTIAGAPDVPYPQANVVAQMGLELIIDPYITVLDVAAGNPLSSVGAWYLFADPKDIRVLECAHLRGHERPEICMKASDKVTIGGGAIGPMSGDFATDNVLYRVRDIFGGTTLDYRGFYFGGHLD